MVVCMCINAQGFSPVKEGNGDRGDDDDDEEAVVVLTLSRKTAKSVEHNTILVRLWNFLPCLPP